MKHAHNKQRTKVRGSCAGVRKTPVRSLSAHCTSYLFMHLERCISRRAPLPQTICTGQVGCTAARLGRCLLERAAYKSATDDAGTSLAAVSAALSQRETTQAGRTGGSRLVAGVGRVVEYARSAPAERSSKWRTVTYILILWTSSPSNGSALFRAVDFALFGPAAGALA